jgi:methyl-accepting chemotaxis protein
MNRSEQKSSRMADPKESMRSGGSLMPRSMQPISRRNIFLDLRIAGRLTLGFLVAALVAALAAGIVGIQRSESLSRQTDFYHNLLQLNTSLTTGRSFLQLMNSKAQQTLEDASVPNPSHETLAGDVAALNNLAALYNQKLNAYAQTGLLDQHPDQLALLNEAGDENLAAQQRTLTSSAQRTWQVYQTAQQEFVGYISAFDFKDAQTTFQQQGQPTNSDALSALQALIQLNDRLASAVDDASSVEVRNQLITTLIVTICAFLAIALVGWFISETLVRRLRHLHRVTRAIEEGQFDERAQVAGRDEIAEVALAVNAMVETIVGLLEETRQQRDALAGAAEHLFSDMRIVNAGDLRVSATVSNDPIGMLANAFNFTVGRFRRLVLRTQTTIEQLEVISRQGLERSTNFISLVRSQLRDVPTSHPSSASPTSPQVPSTGPLHSDRQRAALQQSGQEQADTLVQQVQSTRETLLQTTREELNKRLGGARETVEKASRSIGRLSELISTRASASTGSVTEKMIQAQLQELATMEQLLHKLAWEVRQTQFNVASDFTKLDTALVSLTRAVGDRPESGRSEASEGTLLAAEMQYQELLRQAGSFAVEVNALAKRLTVIIQEMRSGIIAFRLEGTTPVREQDRSSTLAKPPTERAFASSSGSLFSTW